MKQLSGIIAGIVAAGSNEIPSFAQENAISIFTRAAVPTRVDILLFYSLVLPVCDFL